MSKPAISYVPRPDTTPKAELSALAAVYRFLLFDSHGKENAAGTSGTDNSSGDRRVSSRREEDCRQ
jgi:hypothetical protein